MKISQLIKIIGATSSKDDSRCPHTFAYKCVIINSSGYRYEYLKLQEIDRRFGELRMNGKYQHSSKRGLEHERLSEQEFLDLLLTLGWSYE